MVIIQKFQQFKKSAQIDSQICHEKLLKVAQENKKDRHPIHTWANWGEPPETAFWTTTLGGIGCFHCTDLHFRMSNILRNYSIFLQISLEESTFLRTSLSFSNTETPPNSPVTPNTPRHDRQWRETDCVRSASPRRAAKWN